MQQNGVAPGASGQSACNWRSNLLWALVGAVLGNLLAGPMDTGKGALHAWLEQGRAIDAEAVASRAGAGGCPGAK